MSLGHDEEVTLELHVKRYGLTIPAVAARVVDQPSREVRGALDRLVGLRKLFRHATGGPGVYYSDSRKPLSRHELRRRFGVLWFCEMDAAPRVLLSADELYRVASGAAALVGVARVPAENCYASEGKLTILRVAPPTPNLQQVMVALQRAVLAARFRPWLLLASRNLVRVAFLLEGEDQVAELGRWLDRRPLCGLFSDGDVTVGLPGGAIAVPTTPHALKTLRGAP